MNPNQQNNVQPSINLQNPVNPLPAPQQNVQPNTQQPPGPATQAIPKSTKPAINPNSTQNNLHIAEIRDGIVIMNDGSFRSVMMFKSINFDLMSPTEREAVEYSYQSFLNSLYFPVQIFVRSEKVDMQPYLEKLEKIRREHDNMLLAILMDDYLDFIDGLAQQTNIMDKHFYVVIPYFPNEAKDNLIGRRRNKKGPSQRKSMLEGILSTFSGGQTHLVIDELKLEEAKTELRNRAHAVLDGLQQCGVQGLPLDTQELIELYYDGYNPDTATRQHLRNFNDLTAPVITKGEGFAPQPGLDKELEA